MLRILLTGAGSSGHLYPLVAVAEELKKQTQQGGQDLELFFLGDDGLTTELAASINVAAKAIVSPKWRRYFSVENFLDILKTPLGLIQAFYYVWLFMPDLIFSKGGYDSFFPVLAGKFFGIPIVIHESDIIPGKANLWAGKMAKKVFLAFEGAKKFFKVDKTDVVGNPIRQGILAGPDRATAIAAFDLDPNRPVVLITGASQGAKIINDTLLLALVELGQKFQVIHQAGPNNFEEVRKQTEAVVQEGAGTYGEIIKQNYRLYPIFDIQQMALAYAAADVVVSRAGAGTIFEVAAVGKPSIVIPLKTAASNHQLANAKDFEKYGATVIEEDNFTPHILMNEIQQAYENRQELGPKIKSFAKVYAASKVASGILALT